MDEILPNKGGTGQTRRQRAGSDPKRMRGGLEQEGEESSVLGEKCNIKEIGEQTICGDFTILG